MGDHTGSNPVSGKNIKEYINKVVTINGKEEKPIGIINCIVDDASIVTPKNPHIRYEIIWYNIFWGAVLFGTIIAPIYFFGFAILQPVGEMPTK